MCCRDARFALLISLAAALVSCGGPETPKRTAVLRFEDLSGNLSNVWIGRALSEAISGELEGSRHQAILPFATLRQFDGALGPRSMGPGISTERAAALAAGANRIVTGFYTLRNHQLTVTAVEENLENRMMGTGHHATGSEDDLLHLADQIAQELDNEARPPITGSLRALRSYSLGLDEPPGTAQPLLTEAVRLDPDFGPAWVSLARVALASHDLAGFDQVFAAVRAGGSGVRPIDRAVLNLEDARLHGTPAAQTDALAALVHLTPADPFRLRELASAELNQNRFSEAADHDRRLATLLPNDPEVLNELGYALLYSGEEDSARKAFEDYRQARPDEANPLDSLGDFHFYWGRFADAERSYLAAYARDPALLDGGELLKAVWTRLMRNDATAAAQLLNRYRGDRANAHDPLAGYRIAQILRVMGRKGDAEQALQPYLGTGPETARTPAELQRAWWRFLDGGASAPDPGSTLGQAIAVFQRREFPAAAPLWRRLSEQSSPNDWWIRTVYARTLRETGQTQEAARLLKFTPLPQPNRSVSFDEPLVPLDPWRAQSGQR